MMLSAHFAGRAIDVSKTTSAHAFSYGFTSLYGVPHGHAVWLTLPEIFELHVNCQDKDIVDPRGIKYFRKNLTSIVEALGMRTDDIGAQLYEFLDHLNIESDMSKIGAGSKSKQEEIKAMVNTQRLRNNPVKLDLTKIFKLSISS